MLIEDLNSHLFQRAEHVAQREELDFLHEQIFGNATPEFELYLKSSCTQPEGELSEYEKSKERTYYLELVQQIFEGFHSSRKDQDFPEIERSFKEFSDLIKDGKVPGIALENKLDALCKSINLCLDKDTLKRKKENFTKSRDDMNAKISAELHSVDSALQSVENTMRNSINFVDNKILPQINAVPYPITPFHR